MLQCSFQFVQILSDVFGIGCPDQFETQDHFWQSLGQDVVCDIKGFFGRSCLSDPDPLCAEICLLLHGHGFEIIVSIKNLQPRNQVYDDTDEVQLAAAVKSTLVEIAEAAPRSPDHHALPLLPGIARRPQTPL
jgi:hypothetical protein